MATDLSVFDEQTTNNKSVGSTLSDLQTENDNTKESEDAVIHESFMRNIKEDGQFDRDAIKRDVRKKLPHRVPELDNTFAEEDLKRAQAESKFDKQSTKARAVQLRNAKQELDLLDRLLRPVLDAPEEEKETAYQGMVNEAVTKYGMDPKSFAPNYDKEDVDKIHSSAMSGREWTKVKDDKYKEDRLNEWRAVAPNYKARILAGVRDPVVKTAVNFDIMNEWSDVPEAVAIVKGTPLREPAQDTPSGRRQDKKNSFTNRLMLRRDFEKTASPLVGPNGLAISLDKMNQTLGQYEKATPKDKDRLRRATQDMVLFVFSKIEDPSSVVMPGEFERLLRMQGRLDERLLAQAVNTLHGGLGRLPDESLRAMAEVANNLFPVVVDKYRPNYERFKNDVKGVDPKNLDSEIAPYVKFFESKPRGTDKPVTADTSVTPDKPIKTNFEQYTEAKPLTISTKAQAAKVPKGQGIWVKYKSNGKTIITQW